MDTMMIGIYKKILDRDDLRNYIMAFDPWERLNNLNGE